MTVYNVVSTITNSHNFVTDIRIEGTFTNNDKAIRCFNNVKTKIIINDPKYKIAEKNYCKKSIDNLWLCFWINDVDNYYEVNLRIISSIIEN